MQHCCFCAAVSQAPGLGFVLILGIYLTTVEINIEISTLFCWWCCCCYIQNQNERQFNFDDLPIVFISNICIRPYPYFFISFTFLKQHVPDTEGRVVLLSLSPFVWLPASLGRNQELQVPSQLSRSLMSETSLSSLLTFRLLQEGHCHCPETETSDV